MKGLGGVIPRPRTKTRLGHDNALDSTRNNQDMPFEDRAAGTTWNAGRLLI